MVGPAHEDTIAVRDGVREMVSCEDALVADRKDVVSADCESVDRG